jgi:hypothetical protein
VAGSGSLNVVVSMVEASVRDNITAGVPSRLTAEPRLIIGGAGGAAGCRSGRAGPDQPARRPSVVLNSVTPPPRRSSRIRPSKPPASPDRAAEAPTRRPWRGSALAAVAHRATR